MKRLVLGVLAILLMFSVTETNSKAAGAFADVDSSHRAKVEIYYLSQGKIVSGDSNGYFRPTREVTRAEAAAMIGRALNLNGTKRSTDFSDVGSSNFASGYIQSAANQKILSGYSDGTFRPYKVMTRGEMAVVIAKAFGYEFGGTLSGAARALIDRGIAQGYSDGTFGADKKIVRADFSVFLARAINYKYRINPEISYVGSLYVTAEDSLNVRTGPNTNYGKITALPPGTKVSYAYRVGDWVYVKSGTTEGFVHGAYLNSTYVPGQSIDDILSKQTIVIDPGHGGTDPGASGFGIQEKNVVLDTSLKLKGLLAKTPFTYKLTRETDVYLSLSERVAFAKRVGGDMFLSIHANAYNGTANGTETYYYASNSYSSDSYLLASKVQSRMLDSWKLYNRKVKHGNFHVLRENSMPAALLELGFIDNETDNRKLRDPWWRQKAAEAIYLGILDYYKAKGYNVTALYNNI